MNAGSNTDICPETPPKGEYRELCDEDDSWPKTSPEEDVRSDCDTWPCEDK